MLPFPSSVTQTCPAYQATARKDAQLGSETHKAPSICILGPPSPPVCLKSSVFADEETECISRNEAAAEQAFPFTPLAPPLPVPSSMERVPRPQPRSRAALAPLHTSTQGGPSSITHTSVAHVCDGNPVSASHGADDTWGPREDAVRGPHC